DVEGAERTVAGGAVAALVGHVRPDQRLVASRGNPGECERAVGVGSRPVALPCGAADTTQQDLRIVIVVGEPLWIRKLESARSACEGLGRRPVALHERCR